ncbi:integrase core domain-containing protein [Streptomyces sp. NPDC005122]
MLPRESEPVLTRLTHQPRSERRFSESANRVLKRETLRGARRFDGVHACRVAVFRWITRYNTRRRHSANGQQSPIAYERQSATLTLAA